MVSFQITFRTIADWQLPYITATATANYIVTAVLSVHRKKLEND